ncbi:hypothetical protein C2845_PM10G01760 [Panicum miliaceum]|uniref:2'-phosphotransferase n=1 Tax=Panicum miliaceum TaxID=4540 RepID=A0A3L6PAQ7_PANMI|nr:hypothetical protein C2845_PM10G01760 [Panicum miliaceum]
MIIRSLYLLRIFPFRYEKLVAGVAESASALTLQEPDVSSSGVLLDYTSSEEPTTDSDDDSAQSASSLGSKILLRRLPKWYQVYFIRIDRSGYFRMYPALGGPFQSLDQADSAINHHLAKLERPSMHGNSTCSVSLVYMFQRFLEKDNYSIVDRLIHEHNYYPDGTPKRGPHSRRRTNPNEEQHHLVQALLDQYNDDNGLFGNRVHALESLLRHEWIHEKNKWYYHFNFTTKTGNLFFADVSQRQGERAWKVNCCCIVDCNENGQCNGCRNNGSPDMKHPNNTDAYTAGRLDGYLPFGDGELSGFDDLEAEAARLRVVFKGLDDPDAMKTGMRSTVKAMQQQFFWQQDAEDAINRHIVDERYCSATSKVLRHMAAELGLDMRPDGYVRVCDLLRLNLQSFANVPLKCHTVDEIREAVRRDNKQMFSLLEEDGELLIRANQGHTVTTVTSESLLKPILSADEVSVCVHGTYRKKLGLILQSGLNRMARLHVHFSSGLPSDGEVISGMRQNVNVLIHLDVRKALNDGMKLYISDNNVILTEGFDGVGPVKYFEKIETWPGRAPIPFER